MKWMKHFCWFLQMSKEFLECCLVKVIKQGGIYAAISHANFMVKYEKLTPEQKEAWYVNEDRTIEF